MSVEEKLESKKRIAISAVAGGGAYGDEYMTILLMSSVEKLNKSVEKASESSDKLTTITNDLTAKIKTFTWVIVVISLFGLLIAGYGVFFK